MLPATIRPGFKIFVIVVLLGGAVFGLRALKPEWFTKKEGKKDNTSQNSSTPVKKSGGKADLNMALNTWSGFAPIILLNNGLDPNTNCELYQKYGIKLKIEIVDDFAACRNGFKSGAYDIVYCTTDVLPTEMGVGSDMTTAETKQFVQVDWSRGGDAIVVTKGINTVADLKGKSIACAQSTASHSLLLRTLESNQLTMNDIVTPKSTGSVKFFANGIDAATAFKAGEVDAAVVWSPDDGDCVAAIKGAKVLVNTKVATHIIADGLLAKESFILENKDLLVKLVTAWLDMNGRMNNSDDLCHQAAEVCARKDVFNMPADFFYNGIKNVRLTTLGDNKNFFEINPDYQGITGDQLYTKMAQTYKGLSLAKSPLSWNKVSTTEIVEAVNLTQYQEAESAVKFTAVTAEVKNKVAISNKQVTINFPTNSSTLTDEAKATIDKEFVNLAKTFASARVRIEGNTDAVGDAGYNKTLSFKRAQAVADYLTNSYGFDSNRFIVIGNGMTKAVNAGVTGASEQYRRTDFQLVEE